MKQKLFFFFEAGLWTALFYAFYALSFFWVQGSPKNQFIDADSLQITFLMRDIFSGETLEGWRLPPAPYYFPDLVLHFLFWPWNFHPNVLFPAYVLLILFFFALAFHSLLNRLTGPTQFPNSRVRQRGPRLWVLGILGIYLLFLSFYPDHSMPFLPVLLPGFHGGGLLIAFVLWVLLGTSLQKFSIQKALLAILLLVFTWPSDKSILVFFCFPAAATLVVLKRRLYRFWFWIGVIVIGIILGHYLESMLRHSLPFFLSSLDWELQKKGLLANAFDLKKEAAFFGYFSVFPISFWGILLFWLASLVWSVKCWIPKKEPRKSFLSQNNAVENRILFLNLFVFFVILGNIASVWALLFPKPPSVMRYFGGIVIFPFFAGGLNLYIFFKRHAFLFVGAVFFALFSIFALYFGIAQLPKPSAPQKILDFVPKEAACLKKLARDENLHTGLADYWIAKPTEIYSGLPIHQITPNLAPYYWNNNPNRFLKNPYYDFVIVNHLKRDVNLFFGKPKDIKQCGLIVIYIYTGAFGARLRSLYHFPLDTQLWQKHSFSLQPPN